ncbi:hypothetical protein [Nocardia sp. AG03]|uniref:hypothetical protein n=1 Tax=Nocardia sp. AG03 TaxID=3025312 RepID=UPI0024184946|nr:hypothetical protein [Nocardia sp. AG03]
MSSMYFESDSNLSVTGCDRRVTANPTAESPLTPLAMPGLILGMTLLGLGIIASVRLGDWTGDYGMALVVLAYVFYMAAAARLVQWSGFTVWASRHR